MRSLILLIGVVFVTQSCVNRADVIAKGMEWVNAGVPYNKDGRHQGYRTDCSGFASCAWRLSQPGLTTGEFVPNRVCVQTTKDKLERGDLILAPSHHVAIFDGWADGAKTTYWLMQEQDSAHGTVRRQQTYPYGSATDFFPCKVLIACETQNDLQIETQ